MAGKKDQTSFDNEIQRRFNASNSLFSLGVNIGVKSFEHLIGISSAALGLLFSYRSGIFLEGDSMELKPWEVIFWLMSMAGFSFTIFASIRRNYHAGNGLVFLSDRIRNRAHRKLDPENKDYSRNEKEAFERVRKTGKKRKFWSEAARSSFYLGISSFALFVLIDDFLNLIKPLFEHNGQVNSYFVVAAFAFPNIIAGYFFGKQSYGEQNTSK